MSEKKSRPRIVRISHDNVMILVDHTIKENHSGTNACFYNGTFYVMVRPEDFCGIDGWNNGLKHSDGKWPAKYLAAVELAKLLSIQTVKMMINTKYGKDSKEAAKALSQVDEFIRWGQDNEQLDDMVSIIMAAWHGKDVEIIMDSKEVRRRIRKLWEETVGKDRKNDLRRNP